MENQKKKSGSSLAKKMGISLVCGIAAGLLLMFLRESLNGSGHEAAWNMINIQHRNNVDALTGEEIIEIVKNAGITGMGGAGFPTHVKLAGAVGKVDTLILNGAECEPYITSDHRLMLERGDAVIGGAQLMAKAIGLNGAVIGIELNKPDAIEHLKALAGLAGDIRIEGLKTRYPQGAEKQLIQMITGRQVPPGKLPADVGCLV